MVLLLCGSLWAQPAAGQQAARQTSPEQQKITEIQQQIKDLQGQIKDLQAQQAQGRYQRDLERKKRSDEQIATLSTGFVDYKKILYRSSIGDLDIPAYLFQPLKPRGPKGHPALVWVHGGVHSDFQPGSMPFVKQAVERGYVVIAPDYRGSTGYGEAFQEAIDYGGYEVEDSMSAADYLKANVPIVDPERIGMIGWSHGGFITLHSLVRDQAKVFKCGYAGVPVTNLVFRLSYKGPGYEANFTKQKRIGGEVHEKRDIYIERSPVYHVSKIKVPIMVHVATNDDDVNFVEDEMMIHALQYHIPHLAETKIYVDPPGGHGFDRRATPDNTGIRYTPALRDSWNRIWTFLEVNLKPYLDGEGKEVLPD